MNIFEYEKNCLSWTNIFVEYEKNVKDRLFVLVVMYAQFYISEDHKEDASRIEGSFSILRKCQGKYECLLDEMLHIKELSPSLNIQSDSIHSKLCT
jgi:hypothetical protein